MTNIVSFSTWIHCRSSFEVKVALKLINSQDLRVTPKVNNGSLHKISDNRGRRPDKFLW